MTIPILALLLIFGFGVKHFLGVIRPIFRKGDEIYAEVAGRLAESFSGVRVVKGYHAAERESAVFAAGITRLLNNSIRCLRGVAGMNAAAIILMGAIVALVIYLGTKQILAGTLTLGSLGTFIMLLAFLIVPLFQIVTIGTTLSQALAGLDRTCEILSLPVEDDDPHRIAKIGKICGTVEFENVSFAYERGQTVLWNLTFSAKPGSVTALVGPSGSGKSTIIGLIAAFYTPSDGRILIDGVDLSTVKLSSYRTQLGVVLQETFLFDGTIRDNVAFARPEASEEEIIRACKIARVDEFVEQFERKYNTAVGERGVKLSGGQKQRVSIARAILADPRILILDEATSNLDSLSEAYIQEGLKYLMRGRTTFVIAHRLSTTRLADQILMIEDGRIVESGTHDDLCAARSRYYALYTMQHGAETDLFSGVNEGEPATAGEAASQAHQIKHSFSGILGVS